MNKKILPILVILALAALTWLGFVGGQYFYEKSLFAKGNIPDTPEAQQIMDTIKKAYDIETEGAYTFDFSKFPTVFINDPRFPVDPGTLQVIREMTNNPSLDTAGWLDYKMAYHSWARDSILYTEAVFAKAKAENRELTPEERASLTDSYGRSAPARISRPTRNNPVIFKSMKINKDVAYVIVDDGPYLAELALVLVNGNWYIAGFKGIAILV